MKLHLSVPAPHRAGLSKVATTALSVTGVAILIFASHPAHAESIDLASTNRVPVSEAKHGRTRIPGFVRIMSFDELMRLSKPKRTAYLQGLRSMMLELDRSTTTASFNATTDATTDMTTVMAARSQIAALLNLFESSANAADSTGGLPVQEGSNISCGKGLTPVHPKSTSYSADRADSEVSHYACSVRATRSADPCPSGTLPINQDPQTTAFYCATLASYKQLTLIQRSNARAVTASRVGETASTVGMKNFTDPKYESQESIRKQIEAARGKVARPRSADALSFKYPVGVKPPPPTNGGTVPGRSKPTTPPAPEPPAPVDPAKPKAAPRPSNPTPGREEKASAAGDASDVVVAPVAGQAPAKAAEPENVKECAPEDETSKTCNATEVEAARRKYASDPDKDCIYAGGISTYEGGTKRAYHCLAPREFCFGSTSCTSDAGEKMKPDYACKVGQVLCNPLLFGLEADGTSPICIAKGAHATKTCDDQSGEDAVSPLDQKHAGLREAWNDFADRLFTMCHTNQTAATLHCAECGVISKRLFAMNLAARDVKSCGAALKYEASNCDADGSCSVRPGGGDPENKGGKPAPTHPSSGGGTGKITGVPSVWENREPASENRAWTPGHE